MDKKELFIQFIIIGVLFIGAYMYLANRDTIDLKCVISTVDGNEIMMKITTKQDLKIAEYLYTSMDIHNGD